MAQRKIVDKDFSKRLAEACDLSNTVPPYNHGRLTYIKAEIEKISGEKISLESVRKWFFGESRPRPDKMRWLAKLLKVDEGWLSLGLKPEIAASGQAAYKVGLYGAVNLLAGLIQLGGGNPAAPMKGSEDVSNLTAIIGGQLVQMYVTLARKTEDDEFKVTLPARYDATIVVAAVQRGPLRYDFLKMDSEQLAKAAKNKGGFAHVTVVANGTEFSTGKITWARLKTINDLVK